MYFANHCATGTTGTGGAINAPSQPCLHLSTGIWPEHFLSHIVLQSANEAALPQAVGQHEGKPLSNEDGAWA